MNRCHHSSYIFQETGYLQLALTSKTTFNNDQPRSGKEKDLWLETLDYFFCFFFAHFFRNIFGFSGFFRVFVFWLSKLFKGLLRNLALLHQSPTTKLCKVMAAGDVIGHPPPLLQFCKVSLVSRKSLSSLPPVLEGPIKPKAISHRLTVIIKVSGCYVYCVLLLDFIFTIKLL